MSMQLGEPAPDFGAHTTEGRTPGGAKRPKSASVRRPLGHRRLRGDYLRLVGQHRRLWGVVQPPGVRRAGGAQALHPDRHPAAVIDGERKEFPI